MFSELTLLIFHFDSTHYAGFQGAIAARNILLPLSDAGVLESVPATTFTSPEVASVGLSEAEAIEKYGKEKIAVVKRNLSKVDRAVCEGETAGFFKIVTLRKNAKILGATIMAPSAGEMISEISLAMDAGYSFDKLARVMHAYPSYSITLQQMAADVYYEKTLRLKPVYDVLKYIGL
jgi:pyruvate/2-oxoglutarate dehydrogenase complex dihydrolipoamide dehydrogenase (E3) component